MRFLMLSSALKFETDVPLNKQTSNALRFDGAEACIMLLDGMANDGATICSIVIQPFPSDSSTTTFFNQQ